MTISKELFSNSTEKVKFFFAEKLPSSNFLGIYSHKVFDYLISEKNILPFLPSIKQNQSLAPTQIIIPEHFALKNNRGYKLNRREFTIGASILTLSLGSILTGVIGLYRDGVITGYLRKMYDSTSVQIKSFFKSERELRNKNAKIDAAKLDFQIGEARLTDSLVMELVDKFFPEATNMNIQGVHAIKLIKEIVVPTVRHMIVISPELLARCQVIPKGIEVLKPQVDLHEQIIMNGCRIFMHDFIENCAIQKVDKFLSLSLLSWSANVSNALAYSSEESLKKLREDIDIRKQQRHFQKMYEVSPTIASSVLFQIINADITGIQPWDAARIFQQSTGGFNDYEASEYILAFDKFNMFDKLPAECQELFPRCLESVKSKDKLKSELQQSYSIIIDQVLTVMQIKNYKKELLAPLGIKITGEGSDIMYEIDDYYALTYNVFWPSTAKEVHQKKLLSATVFHPKFEFVFSNFMKSEIDKNSLFMSQVSNFLNTRRQYLASCFDMRNTLNEYEDLLLNNLESKYSFEKFTIPLIPNYKIKLVEEAIQNKFGWKQNTEMLILMLSMNIREVSQIVVVTDPNDLNNPYNDTQYCHRTLDNFIEIIQEIEDGEGKYIPEKFKPLHIAWILNSLSGKSNDLTNSREMSKYFYTFYKDKDFNWFDKLGNSFQSKFDSNRNIVTGFDKGLGEMYNNFYSIYFSELISEIFKDTTSGSS